MANQLIRCGTAAGPNYDEGRVAESRADFAHKINIALKELVETEGEVHGTVVLDIAARPELLPISLPGHNPRDRVSRTNAVRGAVRTEWRRDDRVVAYDARGHGASSPAPSPEAYRYEDHLLVTTSGDRSFGGPLDLGLLRLGGRVPRAPPGVVERRALLRAHPVAGAAPADRRRRCADRGGASRCVLLPRCGRMSITLPTVGRHAGDREGRGCQDQECARRAQAARPTAGQRSRLRGGRSLRPNPGLDPCASRLA